MQLLRCNSSSPTGRRVLLALGCLHALSQDRRYNLHLRHSRQNRWRVCHLLLPHPAEGCPEPNGHRVPTGKARFKCDSCTSLTHCTLYVPCILCITVCAPYVPYAPSPIYLQAALINATTYSGGGHEPVASAEQSGEPALNLKPTWDDGGDKNINDLPPSGEAQEQGTSKVG
jgi:hypothetical protein